MADWKYEPFYGGHMYTNVDYFHSISVYYDPYTAWSGVKEPKYWTKIKETPYDSFEEAIEDIVKFESNFTPVRNRNESVVNLQYR